MPRKYRTMFERLVANVVKPDDQNENGCWLWTGRTDGKKWPYGRLNVRINGKHTTKASHREMENCFRDVPLTTDETPDHLCGNSMCQNPDHWEVVPNSVNAARSQVRNPRLPRKST